jgi:K+-sensing histidine kinase KdpD
MDYVFCNNIDKKEISETSGIANGAEIKSGIRSMIDCQTLLSGMSHEMRTHMNSIVAFSFLIKNNGLNINEKEEFVDYIFNSCDQLMSLFDNFLDSAIIDTGNSKVEYRNCKISTILDDLLAEFRVILKRENHENLVLIFENQFSDQNEICIDSGKVARVIRNLFQNAIYNTESGYIKIGYYFRDSNVIFYILDSGRGYSKCKEFILSENLNESLSQHNDTRAAINLYLAKKLIGLMGGTVWVEKNGPSGTGLYFSLPVGLAWKTKTLMIQHTSSKKVI